MSASDLDSRNIAISMRKSVENLVVSSQDAIGQSISQALNFSGAISAPHSTVQENKTSLHFGVACLKRVGYSVRALEERRRAAEHCTRDVLVWTNERLQRWLVSINLKEFASNLSESGVHGGLIALDESFDANSMALALQIPTQNTQARQVLEVEFAALLAAGTERSPRAHAHHAPS